jgi:hypothetical protein
MGFFNPSTPEAGQPLSTFKVGDRVINFGTLGKVLSVEPNGDLILMSVGLTGDFSKWRACPLKCRYADGVRVAA